MAIHAYLIARKILQDLRTPSSFPSDWYGWACHHIAHVATGMAFTCVIAFVGFLALGEYPQKWHLFFLVAVMVVIQQGRQWIEDFCDTAEDFIFTVLYGSGSAIIIFSEYKPGQTFLIADAINIVPVGAIIATHLIVGSVIRAAREIKNGTE